MEKKVERIEELKKITPRKKKTPGKIDPRLGLMRIHNVLWEGNTQYLKSVVETIRDCYRREPEKQMKLTQSRCGWRR